MELELESGQLVNESARSPRLSGERVEHRCAGCALHDLGGKAEAVVGSDHLEHLRRGVADRCRPSLRLGLTARLGLPIPRGQETHHERDRPCFGEFIPL